MDTDPGWGRGAATTRPFPADPSSGERTPARSWKEVSVMHTPEQEPPAGTGPARILVVDDDESVRRSLEAVLALEFEVTGATSVISAHRRMATSSFDAVLTDFTLARFLGYRASRGGRLRRAPERFR